MKNYGKLLFLILVATGLIAARTVQAQEPVTLSYILWEAPQLAPYQDCAAAFTAEHPNITVNVEQPGGWADYWTFLQTGFVAGNAPDFLPTIWQNIPNLSSKDSLLIFNRW
jgi:multiple sugar transport system substrate-binding protein